MVSNKVQKLYLYYLSSPKNLQLSKSLLLQNYPLIIMSAAAVTAAASASRKGKVLLIPHGGGPMPVLGEPSHKELTHWLKTFPKKLPKFSSIVVFSAHWEEKVPTITSGANPSLIYDYYGFPKESYDLKYPAPGNPALAQKISNLLQGAGISNTLDDKRGFDHGMFIPLLLMYPEANIPVVQVSLCSSLDPELHIKMGHALAPLLDEDILILGSGFTFHNMGAFFRPESERKKPNEAFEAFLKETLLSPSLSTAERAQRLVQWATAPGARFCHPREEHLIPLHVCFGAAGETPAEQVFDGTVLAKTSGYLW